MRHLPQGLSPESVDHWNDLANAIASGRAVAFIGAGVSATAGLPSWTKLLRKLINSAKTRHGNSLDIRKIDRAIAEGDFTLTASLLSRLGSIQFVNDLRAEFQKKMQPRW